MRATGFNQVICILFLLINSVSVPSQAQHISLEQHIDNLFKSYDNQTPGVSVAIVKNGKVVFEKGYGMATLEYNVPITSNTVFHVASVSKQFTAFSIYMLENEGKISLDDDIKKYLPELPDYGKVITINHLLAHTSGLRDQWALLTTGGWHLEDVITTEQILKILFNQNALNFEPNTEFGYSNSGYTLLAEIVQRVTGQSFTDYTKANIFEPLGMNNTNFYDDFHRVVENRAYSYEHQNGTYMKKKLSYSNPGPTSLFTTVQDLAKWTNNFKNSKVGNVELLKRFNQISLLDNGDPVIYRISLTDTLYHAKGQIHWQYKGHRLISHGGHDAGFRAFIGRFHEDDVSIITLSNDEHYDILRNGFAIADLVFNIPAKNIKANGVINNSIEDAPFTPDSSYLENFVGEYHSEELKTIYKLSLKENRLVVSHKRLSDIVLTPIDEDLFSGANYFFFQMKFLRKEGEITGFEISNFGIRGLLFQKNTPE